MTIFKVTVLEHISHEIVVEAECEADALQAAHYLVTENPRHPHPRTVAFVEPVEAETLP